MDIQEMARERVPEYQTQSNKTPVARQATFSGVGSSHFDFRKGFCDKI